MISQIVRTEFQSNLAGIGPTALLVIAASLVFFTLMSDPDGDDLELFLVLSLVVSWVMGARIYLRYSRQKHARIYAQLPVTHRQVCIAVWGFTLAGLLVPTFFWLLFLLLHRAYSVSHLLPAVVSFYLGVTALIATIAIATNNVNLSGPRTLFWKWIYTIAFLVFSLVLVASEFGTLIFFLEEGTADWAVIVPVLLLTSVGLVMADIWLHQRADNYLG